MREVNLSIWIDSLAGDLTTGYGTDRYDGFLFDRAIFFFNKSFVDDVLRNSNTFDPWIRSLKIF